MIDGLQNHLTGSWCLAVTLQFEVRKTQFGMDLDPKGSIKT
jgi:hypothetical protein